MWKNNWLALFLTAIFLFSITVKSAEAIPAFARKYKTSCTTCHMIFPRLTPFGTAFRINSYQMPADE